MKIEGEIGMALKLSVGRHAFLEKEWAQMQQEKEKNSEFNRLGNRRANAMQNQDQGGG